MSKWNVKFSTNQNKSVIVHVCFVLFIFCLYICICECLLQNNNHQTKHKNNTNCGSAFEPGASGLPYYCASICVRSWCNWCASSVDSKTKQNKKRVLQIIGLFCKRALYERLYSAKETCNFKETTNRSQLIGHTKTYTDIHRYTQKHTDYQIHTSTHTPFQEVTYTHFQTDR